MRSVAAYDLPVCVYFSGRHPDSSLAIDDLRALRGSWILIVRVTGRGEANVHSLGALHYHPAYLPLLCSGDERVATYGTRRLLDLPIVRSLPDQDYHSPIGSLIPYPYPAHHPLAVFIQKYMDPSFTICLTINRPLGPWTLSTENY